MNNNYVVTFSYGYMYLVVAYQFVQCYKIVCGVPHYCITVFFLFSIFGGYIVCSTEPQKGHPLQSTVSTIYILFPVCSSIL